MPDPSDLLASLPLAPGLVGALVAGLVGVAAGLYALVTLVLLAFGTNHLWLAARHLRAGGMRPPPPAPEPAAWPRVTVQLPLYNEPLVAARLIDAVAALDYPAGRLDVQVLDDSADATRDVVAERAAHWRHRGVTVDVLARARRDGFKAGALAHGLARSRAELVAVFDADFVPPPDFLRRVVPRLVADPGLGLVQARWAHLNAGASWLTRVQAALLDAHFVVEQDGRAAAGCFLSFNGTAGVWRRACIDDAGGWQADTLTEDLDLSYRAQLRGWRLAFAGDVAVPAELPATAAAWRQQQARWTKGTAETARKLLGRLWARPPGGARLPLRVRLEGTLHLGGFVVYPTLLLAALLHAPLLAARALGAGPPDAYFAALGVGLVGFAGVLLAHAATARTLDGPAWPRRLWRTVPLLLAASAGLAVTGTRAAWGGLRGRRTPFVRTPKTGGRVVAPPRRAAVPERRWEAALALYSVAGLAALVALGAWAGVGFQLLFAVGFGLLATADRPARVRPSRAGRGRLHALPVPATVPATAVVPEPALHAEAA